MHYPKVLERVDSPEQIFHRSFPLGAPDQWANYLPQRAPQRAKVLTQRSNLSRTIYLNGRKF